MTIPVGLGLTAVRYPVLLWAFPEPRDAFSPDGPRAAPPDQPPTPLSPRRTDS